MKIICVDNFNRESRSDNLVAENVNAYYAKFIVEKLNENLSGDQSPNFYRVVTDNYKLYTFEP